MLRLGSWDALHAISDCDVHGNACRGDVVAITVVALLMSFLATLYPAWRAARTQPAEALRYE